MLGAKLMTVRMKRLLAAEGVVGRKVDILERICDGMDNESIGHDLFVTDKTVKFHITDLNRLLGCKSRLQLMVWVVERYLAGRKLPGGHS